jgi:hypothetical protein
MRSGPVQSALLSGSAALHGTGRIYGGERGLDTAEKGSDDNEKERGRESQRCDYDQEVDATSENLLSCV